MDLAALIASPAFNLTLLPFLIFLARICDVTLDTVRIIYIQRGMRYVAPVLGFFEVLIWLMAITQIMKNLTSPLHYIAYAAGFAAGNYVGIIVEEKLSIGTVLVRVITRKDATQLIDKLRAAGYRVTIHEACGSTGPSNIVFTIAKRKELKNILKIIRQNNPTSLYTIEDLRYAHETTAAGLNMESTPLGHPLKK
jgi:uncharacterized protein YebE (UPF0316 family)